MPIRGRTKSKKDMWVRSGGRNGRWHRVDPTNGRMTACGCLIDTLTWGRPQPEVPATEVRERQGTLDKHPTPTVICGFTECSGTKKK